MESTMTDRISLSDARPRMPRPTANLGFGGPGQNAPEMLGLGQNSRAIGLEAAVAQRILDDPAGAATMLAGKGALPDDVIGPRAALPVDPDSNAALLKGLSGVKMPQQPATQLPSGTAPLPRLGGQIDPRLLAQIQAIFSPQPEIKGPPSALGGLITGGR